MKTVCELAGASVKLSGGYDGWNPNPDSAILHTMKEGYKALYGKEPAVMAIHAGLECGIRLDNFVDFDEGDEIEIYEIELKKATL